MKSFPVLRSDHDHHSLVLERDKPRESMSYFQRNTVDKFEYKVVGHLISRLSAN